MPVQIKRKSIIFPRIISLILLLTIFSFVSAQDIVKPEMKSYQSSDGKLYWNKNMPVYLRVSANPSDTGYVLTNEKTEPYYFDTEGDNFIRTRWATDTQTKQATQPKTEVSWRVIADGQSPKSLPDFSGSESYQFGSSIFYGNNLKIDIISADRLSGVEKTYFSLNGEPYKEFSDEISLAREGDYVLKYYSTDKVGNIETPKESSFRLDLTAPQTAYTISGGTFKNIFSTATKILLNAQDTLSGLNKIFYQIDSGNEMPYTGAISVANLENGQHKLSFRAQDNVLNKENTKSFDFYLDKMAPILTSTIIGDQFAKDGKIYFSGRSKLKLTGVDDKAGLQEIRYSLNAQDFTTYSEPFYLPGVSGLHTVTYFALDSMQNKSETKRMIDAHYQNYVFSEEKIYVDLTKPALSFRFAGVNYKSRDTLFLSGKSKINLIGQDSESGIAKIVYTVDGQQFENEYKSELPLTDFASGTHRLNISCFDNVNNKTEETIVFVIDNTPPSIHYFFTVSPYAKKDAYDVYPQNTGLFLAAGDTKTGAKSVQYSLNSAKIIPYTGLISNFTKGKLNTVQVVSTDELGNESQLEIKFYVE